MCFFQNLKIKKGYVCSQRKFLVLDKWDKVPKLLGYKALNQRSKTDTIPLPTDNGKSGNSTDIVLLTLPVRSLTKSCMLFNLRNLWLFPYSVENISIQLLLWNIFNMFVYASVCLYMSIQVLRSLLSLHLCRNSHTLLCVILNLKSQLLLISGMPHCSPRCIA